MSFFADVSSEMIYPLLPLFLVGVLGASKAELGLIEGAAVFVVSAMTALAGFRSDQSGRRVRWIQLGYGLPMVGKAIIALATAWPLVLGGRLLDRFGKGLRSAPRDAMIAGMVAEDQRGRAFGVHRALDTTGALIGVLISAALLWWFAAAPQQGGDGSMDGTAAQTPAWVYRVIFCVGAGLGVASFLLTFLVREPDAAKPVREAGKRSDAPARVADEAASANAKRARLPRSYWAVLGVLVLFSFANSSDTFILLRASDLGYSPLAVVLVYAMFNATYAAFSYPAGVLSDRLGRWRVIAAGWLIYAGVYAGFAFLPATHAWGMWPLMAIYGVYMALTEGVGKALIADHAPKERHGTAIGIYYAITGLTTLLASLLAGFLWDRSGPTAAFLLGAGFAGLALVAMAVVRVAVRK